MPDDGKHSKTWDTSSEARPPMSDCEDIWACTESSWAKAREYAPRILELLGNPGKSFELGSAADVHQKTFATVHPADADDSQRFRYLLLDDEAMRQSTAWEYGRPASNPPASIPPELLRTTASPGQVDPRDGWFRSGAARKKVTQGDYQQFDRVPHYLSAGSDDDIYANTIVVTSHGWDALSRELSARWEVKPIEHPATHQVQEVRTTTKRKEAMEFLGVECSTDDFGRVLRFAMNNGVHEHSDGAPHRTSSRESKILKCTYKLTPAFKDWFRRVEKNYKLAGKPRK